MAMHCPENCAAIGVYLDEVLGPDLDVVAAFASLSPDDVVRLHSARPYRVLLADWCMAQAVSPCPRSASELIPPGQSASQDRAIGASRYYPNSSALPGNPG